MPLMRLSEIAEEFGVSVCRLQRMCRAKKIRHVNLGTDQRATYAIDRKHVLAWLDSLVVETAEPLTPTAPTTRRLKQQITGREIYERRQARLRA